MDHNIKSFRDLIAWQKSIALVTNIYLITGKFPDREKFGLVSQLNRAAVSVPTNIAEGWGRETPGSFMQFLRISRGSNMEVQTLLEIAKNTKLLEETDYNMATAKSEEVGKIIQGLINSIKGKMG